MAVVPSAYFISFSLDGGFLSIVIKCLTTFCVHKPTSLLCVLLYYFCSSFSLCRIGEEGDKSISLKTIFQIVSTVLVTHNKTNILSASHSVICFVQTRFWVKAGKMIENCVASTARLPVHSLLKKLVFNLCINIKPIGIRNVRQNAS